MQSKIRLNNGGEILEKLIRRRLAETKELTKILASFEVNHHIEPAIFYQKAPDDISFEGNKQYPRITFIVDKFSNAERGIMGVLGVDIICAETSVTPEQIEAMVRRSLEGVFFTPSNGVTFSAKWRESSLIEEAASDKTVLVVGISLSFDLYEYPLLETSDPDPIAAMCEYALAWDKDLVVIGRSELPEFFTPTRERPAIYFSKENIKIETQTNTVVWMRGFLNIHLFAPSLIDRHEWLEQLNQSLGYAGEVTMLDKSPMFILSTNYDYHSDEIKGQIRLDVKYGLLRRFDYAHTLMQGNFSKVKPAVRWNPFMRG